MKSNGGVLSADEVVHQPVTTVLSGPAAGALGAALVTQAAGYDRVLTFDGGGTSTDVSVVRHGEPALTTEGTVGAYPCKIPMIDIVTVGAGGGSVAWLAPEGSLKVGPRSAGADPGPLCYGRGGMEPTVTDAHLVLGRIPPHLLAGELPLSVEAAHVGLTDLGAKLGLDLTATAAGILEISAWNQANALRQITVQRGLDVRDFALTTFGGSGSLLLCRLIDIVGVPVGVVPRDPGNLSAFGLLTVDVRVDHVQTHVARHAQLDHATVSAELDLLQSRAPLGTVRGGLRGGGSAVRAHCRPALLRPGLRGAGAAGRRSVLAGRRRPSRGGLPRRTRAALRLLLSRPARAAGRVGEPARHRGRPDPAAGPAPSTRHRHGSGRSGERPVCFDAGAGYAPTPIYWRPDLPAGAVVTGPAVIEEYGATVPLHPGFTATVDGYGNLVVERRDALQTESEPEGRLPFTGSGS